jgi:hypothetical protein
LISLASAQMTSCSCSTLYGIFSALLSAVNFCSKKLSSRACAKLQNALNIKKALNIKIIPKTLKKFELENGAKSHFFPPDCFFFPTASENKFQCKLLWHIKRSNSGRAKYQMR